MKEEQLKEFEEEGQFFMLTEDMMQIMKLKTCLKK